MAYNTHTDTDTSLTGLVRGAMDDARELVREEIALAKAEAREELNKAMSAAAEFGVAAVAAWFALTFVLGAVALGMASAFGWPAWTGLAIVGVVLAVVAGVMFAVGRAAVRRVRALPRTVESLKENFR